jgi:hypothetical protein
MQHLKLSTVPTPVPAGRLGRLFNTDTPKRLLKNFGNYVVNSNRYIFTPSLLYDYK